MADDGRFVLRSYRLAFELERRVHRIDRYRIPLPYGLPLVALGYDAALLVAVVALRGAPGLGSLLALLPLPVQLVFLPGLGAHLLCRATADGRPAHEALAARIRFLVLPRRLVGLRRVPPQPDVSGRLAAVGDERTADLPCGTLKGPAEVAIGQPARAVLKRRSIELQQVEDRPMLHARVVRLRATERLVVR